MKYIVVGSSHAGFEVIQTLLKEEPEAEIHLYERGDKPSFLSCGIQSYLEDISPSLDSLHYANADSYQQQGVNVHINSDVVDLDTSNKTITVNENDESNKVVNKILVFKIFTKTKSLSQLIKWIDDRVNEYEKYGPQIKFS